MNLKTSIPFVTLACAAGTILISILMILLVVGAYSIPEIRITITREIAQGLTYLVFYAIFMIVNGILTFFRKYKFAGASIAVVGFFLLFSFWFFGIFLFVFGIIIFQTKENLKKRILKYMEQNNTAYLSDLANKTGKNEADIELEINSMISKGEKIEFDKVRRRIIKKI